MTYKETIDRYIKNEECRGLMIFYFHDLLDDEITPDLYGGVLGCLFRRLGFNDKYHRLSRPRNAIFMEQMQHIYYDICNQKTRHVYDWKSLEEWLDTMSDNVLKGHYLFIYDKLVSKLEGEESKHFSDVRVHRLSTAIGFLHDIGRKNLGVDVVAGGDKIRGVDFKNVRKYYNDNIAPRFWFLRMNGSELNDFEEIGPVPRPFRI